MFCARQLPGVAVCWFFNRRSSGRPIIICNAHCEALESLRNYWIEKENELILIDLFKDNKSVNRSKSRIGMCCWGVLRVGMKSCAIDFVCRFLTHTSFFFPLQSGYVVYSVLPFPSFRLFFRPFLLSGRDLHERRLSDEDTHPHRRPSDHWYSESTSVEDWRKRWLLILQIILSCCTISSTLMVHLHLTILHDIQTQTTAAPSLQLITGE